jgi:hypothetical protein
MADKLSPIPEIPNFADEQILQDEIRKNQRHLKAHQATEGTPEAAGGSGVPQGAGGAGGARRNVTENPCGDLNMAGWMKNQMELQTNPFLKAIAALTANQGAAAAVGGAHQQTSEQAAPPVSVEEKGKTTGGKRKLLFFCLSPYKLKLTVFMLLGGPHNTIKTYLVFTALFFFAPFSVFSSRMSEPC